MCGRLKTPEKLQELALELEVTRNLFTDYRTRPNTPPTGLLPVLTTADGERILEPMKWGLLPSWAKDDKMSYSTFNARADTIAGKPAFRSAWKAGRRCLIFADGFYEWRKADKQPFFVSLGNKQPMAFAGLWEERKDDKGKPVRSCTIITTEANSMMEKIHDRMPVILGHEQWASWLGEDPCPNPAALLVPFAAERMTSWPVDKRVGNVKNNDAQLTEKIKLA